MAFQDESSLLIAKLCPLIVLDAIYNFYFLWKYKDGKSTKAPLILSIVSAAVLVALTLALHFKSDGNIN
jgi:hypothetical protein